MFLKLKSCMKILLCNRWISKRTSKMMLPSISSILSHFCTVLEILVPSVLLHLTLIWSGVAMNFHLDPLTPDPSHWLTPCLVSCLNDDVEEQDHQTIRDNGRRGAFARKIQNTSIFCQGYLELDKNHPPPKFIKKIKYYLDGSPNLHSPRFI